MADIANCLAHCPARKATNSLLGRLIVSPNKIALSHRAMYDTAAAFVTPFHWKGALLPAGRIKTGPVTAFLKAFGVGGCASSAEDITPAYVSPVAYQQYTCQQLAQEA